MTWSTRGLLLLFLASGAGCATNEFTGRRQLMLVNTETVNDLGRVTYQEILAKSVVATDEEAEPVRRVGERIAAAANRPEFHWEFNTIIDDKTMNAWCLPGGKIAFYTGIFPVLEDEAGMAFVMGHEVGHALMHHGAERMSQNRLAGGTGILLGASVGVATRDPRSALFAMAAFGAATNVAYLLPFSRRHETEADRVGLELMAKAGYDPHAAVQVWKRMASANPNQPSQWLSTHPSHETRIRDLEERLPEALAIFEKSEHAPVAKLPAIGERSAKGPGGNPGSALVPGFAQVQSSPPRAGTLPNGARALRFEVQFDRDLFVQSVDISSPTGEKTSVEINAAVPGGRPKILTVATNDAAQSGDYTLRFHGFQSGRPVSISTPHGVR
jgi:Zn-dependent protease with chaperone function